MKKTNDIFFFTGSEKIVHCANDISKAIDKTLILQLVGNC